MYLKFSARYGGYQGHTRSSLYLLSRNGPAMAGQGIKILHVGVMLGRNLFADSEIVLMYHFVLLQMQVL